MHDNFTELSKHVDVQVLPKEYGGKIPLSEMIADYKQKLQINRELILSNDKMDIIIPETMDWFKNENAEAGVSGSFRKMEID